MTEKFSAPYFTDYVGRRRKLPAIYIRQIMEEYAKGERVSSLAFRYGVSTTTIRTITYHTVHGSKSKEAGPSDGEPTG